MNFILTKAPIIEDILVKEFNAYVGEDGVRFGEQYPNFGGVRVSNDHPFESMITSDGSLGEFNPSLFPSVTIVSSNDGEIPGMAKGWQVETLADGDLDTQLADDWYLSNEALASLKTVLHDKNKVYGLKHGTMWRDSVSFEVWSENIQIKNVLYNLIRAYLTGPKIIDLHKSYDFVIHSNTIQGQRSGYYNFDFGRTLYGGRVSLSVDYPILQAVYDTEISTLAEIQHSYQEVIDG